jgi:hypothetical protein
VARLGVSAERTYVDHGLTGTNRERPALREALAACRNGDTQQRQGALVGLSALFGGCGNQHRHPSILVGWRHNPPGGRLEHPVA